MEKLQQAFTLYRHPCDDAGKEQLGRHRILEAMVTSVSAVVRSLDFDNARDQTAVASPSKHRQDAHRGNLVNDDRNVALMHVAGPGES
jgi:hypothetical protein